jgi:hypothetical protein
MIVHFFLAERDLSRTSMGLDFFLRVRRLDAKICRKDTQEEHPPLLHFPIRILHSEIT